MPDASTALLPPPPPSATPPSPLAATATRLLDLPDALLAYVLSFCQDASSVCRALQAHRHFGSVANAEPETVWSSLSSVHGWLLRCAVDETPLQYCKRVHLSVPREYIVAVGGDEGLSIGGPPGVALFDPRYNAWSDADVTAPGWPSVPQLEAVRNAPCAAVDTASGWMYVVGGFDNAEEEAMASVEVFSGSRAINPGAQWDVTGTIVPPLPEGRCFAAAACDGQGMLFTFGGGDIMSRGARVTKSIVRLELDPNLGKNEDDTEPAWEEVGELIEARCGAALAADARSSLVYLCGGYGGGHQYHQTVELYDMAGERPGELLPLMAQPRSGCGAGVGPDGALYVVGGSHDGSTMLSSCERYDRREGRWQALPPIEQGPRGYLSATFALDGCLYTAGGCGEMGDALTTFEAFDTRAGKWRGLPPLIAGPRSCHAMLHMVVPSESPLQPIGMHE